MSRNMNLGLYAVAVALGVIGALSVGVPIETLAVLAIVLACPLMMLVMMRGAHRTGDHGDDATRPRRPSR